jgi:hypothetical protein
MKAPRRRSALLVGVVTDAHGLGVGVAVEVPQLPLSQVGFPPMP